MKKITPLLIGIVVFYQMTTAQICDNFNVPNSTTLNGWTEQSGDWLITDSTLQTPLNGSWVYATMDGSSQADGCVTFRAIYGSTSQTKFAGVVGRYSSNISNIMFKIQDNSSSGYWNKCFIYCNDLSVYSFDGNFGTDAIIQMEYSGADVTVRVDINRDGNWDVVNSTTVTNVGTGLCGVGSYYNCFVDDFCYGTECCTTPAAAGTITGSSSVCQGEIDIAYAVPLISDATTYVWEYSGTGATIQGTTDSITIDYAVDATSGNLTVYGQNSCGDGIVSANYPVTINPLPADAGSISGDDFVCQGTNNVSYAILPVSDATSYVWNYSGTDVSISGTTNSVILNFGSTATSGDLTVIGDNACGSGAASPSFSITVDPCFSISEINATAIQIMPNPSDGNFIIDFSAIDNDFLSISITNAVGLIVFHEELKTIPSSKQIEINLSSYPSGIYTIRFLGHNFSIVTKAVILN